MVSGIDSIISSLSDDLKARVEAVIQLTEQKEDLETKLDIAKRDLKRIKIALEALSGGDVPIRISLDDPQDTAPEAPAEVPQSRSVLPAAPAVVDPRPVCPSCQSGRMNYTSRTLNNGKQVLLWLCGECRNERF